MPRADAARPAGARVLGVFIAWPWLAFVAATLFGALYQRRGGRWPLVATTAWLLYGVYEYGMKLRILCSGECNIRVDLLLLYPVLIILSVAAVVSAARRPRR